MRSTRTTRTRVGLAVTGLLLGGGLLGVPRVLTPSAGAADAPWTTVKLAPLAEGQKTVVEDISNAGIAVGSSGGKPVRWSATGTPTALNLAEGCTTGVATSVTAAGVAAGTMDCGTGDADVTGAIWAANGTVQKLEAPLGIKDISSIGITVGQRNPASTTADRAFVFIPGRPRLDLP